MRTNEADIISAAIHERATVATMLHLLADRQTGEAAFLLRIAAIEAEDGISSLIPEHARRLVKSETQKMLSAVYPETLEVPDWYCQFWAECKRMDPKEYLVDNARHENVCEYCGYREKRK